MTQFTQQPDGSVTVDEWDRSTQMSMKFLRIADPDFVEVRVPYVRFNVANGSAEYRLQEDAQQDIYGLPVFDAVLVRRWASVT